MKKNLPYVILLLIVMACGKSNELSSESSNESNNVSSKSKESSISEVNSDILIDLETVKAKINNYKESHPGVSGNEYALRSWISLEELKNYIAQVEKDSKEKGITVSGIDFIHIQNIAARPGMSNLDNSDYDLTLLMAPTYQDSLSHIAFDPVYSDKNSPKPLKELLDSLDSKKAGTFGPKPSTVGNSIMSCPNNCP